MDPPLLMICTSLKSKQKPPPLPTINYFQLRTVKNQCRQNHDLGGVLLYNIFGAGSIPIFMLVTGYWLKCGGGGGGDSSSSSSSLSISDQSPDYKIQHTADNQNNHYNTALLLQVPMSFLSNFQGMKKCYTLNRCYDQRGGAIHTKII